jgi:hypothetical protein
MSEGNDDNCYITCWNCAIGEGGGCHSEHVACQNNKDCFKLGICIDDCDNNNHWQACVDDCYDTFANGADLMDKLRDCIYCYACETACEDDNSFCYD